MAKKSVLGEAIDAVRTVGGAALGAGAAVAASVVVGTVANAVMKGGRELGEATPAIAKVAGDTVAKPILPKKQKRAAAKRVAKKAVAKKRVTGVKRGPQVRR